MKKLVKEIGFSVLISMTSGSSGTEVIKKTAKMLSSSAFDRRLEKEADYKAVDYLIRANVNPEPLANLLYRLSDQENEAIKYLTWISTHPDSKERAESIIEYSKNKLTDYEPILANQTWQMLIEQLNNEKENQLQ
jgi:predicted Zn-dependent protease